MKPIVHQVLLLFVGVVFLGSCDTPETTTSTEKDTLAVVEVNTTQTSDTPQLIKTAAPTKTHQLPTSFDPHKYYRITSQFTGEEKSLNIIDDEQASKVNLDSTADIDGQAWKIVSLNNGYFRLTTKWQGEEKPLDVYNDNAADKKLCLDKTSNNSGQAWKIQEVGNHYYRLSTQFLGEDRSLDVLNNGERNKVRLMETGDYSGQLWKIIAIN